MRWEKVLTILSLVRKGPRLKDSFTVSVVGGLIGSLFVDISNVLLWRKGQTEMLYGHFAASMFMSPFRTKQRKNFILGQIFHMITGGLLGIPIFYILKKTGRDNLFLKGMFGGFSVWGTLYAFGIRMKLYMAKPHLTKTHYSYFWHNMLFGLVTAYSIVWLADPEMFPKRNELNKFEQEENTTAYNSFEQFQAAK
jgi:hypothetical protein